VNQLIGILVKAIHFEKHLKIERERERERARLRRLVLVLVLTIENINVILSYRVHFIG